MQDKRHIIQGVPGWVWTVGPLIALLVLYVGILATTWDGFGPRDAEPYSYAALRWIREGTWLGENHWGLRYPLMLPMVISFSILGPSEFAACVPNMLYQAGLIALSFFFLRRHAGILPATVMGLLLVTSGFFTFQATELRIYGVEIFFTVAALFLIVDAGRREGPQYARFALAGVMSGMAWLCRESSVFLPPVVVAAAFLWGAPRIKRAAAAALGGAAVLVTELTVYLITTGDPLFRLKTDLGHGKGSPETKPLAGPGGGMAPDEFWILPFKNILMDPILLPVVLGGVGLAVLALLRVPPFRLERRDRAPLLLFAAGSAAALAICSYLLSLETTEYFPLLTYTAHLAAALVIGRMIAEPSRLPRALGAVLLFGLMLGNLWGNDLRDDRDYYPSHLLRTYIMETRQPVATDTTTAARVRIGLMLRGMTEAEARSFLKVVPPGETVPPDTVVYTASSFGSGYSLAPQEGWTLLDEWSRRPRPSGKRVLAEAVPPSLLPGAIRNRVGLTPPARLYRTPAAPHTEPLSLGAVPPAQDTP